MGGQLQLHVVRDVDDSKLVLTLFFAFLGPIFIV